MVLAPARVSLEHYLALPESGPPWLEYIRGEVVEKSVGNAFHFQVIANMCAALEAYRQRHGGKCGSEGRSRFEDSSDPRFMLPDVSFFRRGMRYRDGAMLFPPTVAIEVRSPGQSLNSQRERAAYFMAHGVEEAWVVNYDPKLVELHGADGRVATFSAGTVASLALLDFSITFDALFSGFEDEWA